MLRSAAARALQIGDVRLGTTRCSGLSCRRQRDGAAHTLLTHAATAPACGAQALEGSTKIDDELEKLRLSLPAAKAAAKKEASESE